MQNLPIIDVEPLLRGQDATVAAAQIRQACLETGFFYAIGHGVRAETMQALADTSHRFFAMPLDRKMDIAMARGGRAWRGYFPIGGELTSGRPDLKEGLYFGEELGDDDPRVRAGWPLHGGNLFPEEPPELRPAVLSIMREMETAAHAIIGGVALSLGLDADYFRKTYTAKPTLLFRTFHYPPSVSDDAWGVGEHTDYGLLTLLAQDALGGLQVKTTDGWIEAPPIEGALVCNIGDMLDRLTGGAYRSTPHRVRNVSGKGRLSFPFFFDPAFDAEIVPLPLQISARGDATERWDGADLSASRGAYGDYLLAKVSKAFPELAKNV